ncbi:MAG: alpha-ketoglutarate-dependent dioxygenase AlkB [Xanthomonadaceae bacterium]|nr:alpha-ketoglutarate-dependent dioxygenase AlkB [Xanthomonadaceae bacterium]
MQRNDGFEAIALPGAEVRLARAWLSPADADALFAALRARIPWETHRIRMFGREIDSPRLSCWIGDPGAVYTYSGTRFEPRPWPPALADLRRRLTDALDLEFDSVLANLYRDGRDRMGWHSDDEPELGLAPAIASLSLGGARRFLFKPKGQPRRAVDDDGTNVRGSSEAGKAPNGERIALTLDHGSLLVMAGETQRLYLHALPATATQVAPRINLTFRRIVSREP